MGVLLAVALSASGCVHGGGELIGAGLLAGAAVASAAMEHRDPEEIVYDRVVVVHDPVASLDVPPPPFPPPGAPSEGPEPRGVSAAGPTVVGSPVPGCGQVAPAAPAQPPVLQRAPFDREFARALLEQVDIAGCRYQGAPHGVLHAAVVFAPSGSTSRIVIAAPMGLSAQALACIGERVGAVKVPPFIEGDERLIDAVWQIP